MSSYSTNEFKSGLKIMIDNDPYVIVENEFVKPGKGQAFNRVRIRNLKSGRTLERSFRSGDTVEGADIQESEMQYLYSDGDFWHFMVPDNFEQHTAGKEAMGDSPPSWPMLLPAVTKPSPMSCARRAYGTAPA